LFASADLMVKSSVSPNTPAEFLLQLQARTALLPLLIMANEEDCDGVVELCSEA
jgi:hypothetical protein